MTLSMLSFIGEIVISAMILLPLIGAFIATVTGKAIAGGNLSGFRIVDRGEQPTIFWVTVSAYLFVFTFEAFVFGRMVLIGHPTA